MNNVSVASKRVNRLLDRTEYLLEVKYDGGLPSRTGILDAVAEVLNLPKDLTVIVKTLPQTGRRAAKVELYVYNSAESLRAIEPRYILVRNGFLLEKKRQQGG